MGDSALLRKELRKIYHKIDLLEKENVELRSQVIQLKEEKATITDRYESEIEYLVRRLNYYENEHAPSSTGSMYNAERKKFQKEEALLDSEGTDNTANKDNPSTKNDPNMDLNGRKAGPPQGYMGISHHNRSEYTKRYDVHRCADCRDKHVTALRPVIHQMYDFDGDRISVVAGTLVIGHGVNATNADTLQKPTVPLYPVRRSVPRLAVLSWNISVRVQPTRQYLSISGTCIILIYLQMPYGTRVKPLQHIRWKKHTKTYWNISSWHCTSIWMKPY